MKVKLHARKCFEVRVGSRVVGTFFQHGREWNGMADLRCLETAGQLVVHAPQGYGKLAAMFDDIFDTGTTVSVASLSPGVAEKIAEFEKNPVAGAVEYESWLRKAAA